MGELADRLESGGNPVSVEVRWGVRWEIVLDLVERDRPDLVVKPASGLNRSGQVFFGSTAIHLFRRCPCPVWVVGDEGRLPAKIMAAVDPSSAVQRRAAATRILDWADRDAAWSESTVHVVAAWHAAAAELLRDDLSAAEWKAYIDDARDRTESDLRALLSERPDPLDDDRIHLLEVAPQEVLPRFCEEQDVELIVMGTLARGDRVGDLLGETAETIIRQIRSSVLTIPPGAGG